MNTYSTNDLSIQLMVIVMHILGSFWNNSPSAAMNGRGQDSFQDVLHLAIHGVIYSGM